MPIRGENIGTAYVRILADGADLDDTIRKSFKDSEPVFKQQGNRHSKAYTKAFADYQKSAPNQRILDESLRDALVRTDALDAYLKSPVWKRFRAGMGRQFGEAGDHAAKRLEEQLVQGMDFDRLEGRLGNITAEVSQSIREITRLEVEERARADREHKESVKEVKSQYEDLINSVDRLNKGLSVDTSRHSLIKDLREIRVEMGRLDLTTHETNLEFDDHYRALRLMHPELNRVNRIVNDLGDGFGRAFGKGSRNDFLNFMGVVAGGSVRLLNVLPNLARSLLDFVGRARLAGERGGPLGALGSVALDLGKVLGGLGAAFGAAFLFAGPLFAILSQLVGIIAALVSSLSFALVGALGAIPAVALPAVAGIAALALAFFDLDKAEKAMLKNDVKPVVEAFKDLADVARDGVFSNLGDQADRFAQIMESSSPLIRAIGHAVSDVGDAWLDMMEGPGFERFMEAMTRFLPDAVRDLGEITGNTFGGIGGLLVGLIPFMREVLDYLVDITGQFNDWGNSARGRNEVREFFDDAGDSISAVGEFLGAVRDLFNEIVSQGRESGDSIFESMAAGIDDWTAAIQANPDILGDWFDSAEAFADVIGNVLEGLGKVFSALDNEFSRSFATTIFETLAVGLEAFATILETVAGILGISEDNMLGFVGQVAAAAFILPRLTAAGAGVSAMFSGLVGSQATAISKMAALSSAARGLAGVGGLMALVAGSQQANEGLGILFNTLGGAATGFAVGGPIGALIGGGLGGLLGIANAARKADGGVEDMTATFEDLAATLDTTTGSITENTRAYIYNQLASKGVLGALEAEGVSRRTVINAIAGERGARRELNGVLREGEATLRNEQTALDGLIQKRADLAAAASPDAANYDPNAQDRIDVIDEEIAALETSIDRRRANIDSIRDATGATREAVGRAREQIAAIRDFNGALRDLPKNIRTKIDAEGIVPTRKGIAKVAAEYKLIDNKEIKSLIAATGTDFTVKQVQKVLDKMQETDAFKVNPELDADDRKVNTKVRDASQALAQLARSVFSPTIDADNSRARSKISETERWLNSIQDEIVYVNVERRGGGDQEFASGGIIPYTQRIIAGEDGAEAVVPLNRPLSQVDPSVRFLSAVAQGLATGGVGKTIDVGGLTVIAPQADPHAVAVHTVNELASTGYF